MSRDRVQIVREAYEAWNGEDFETVRSLLHPRVEWRTSGAFPGLKPVYHGLAGVREFWDSLKEPWEYFAIHIENAGERGGAVVATVRFEAVGRESGAKVELGFVNVWRVEDGLIVRFASYPSLDEALEGLETHRQGDRDRD